MTVRLLHPALFAIAFILPTLAFAQRDNRTMESGVTDIVNSDSDGSDAETAFKGNAPQSPKDNGMPRFALVGKDRQFYLGIGGQFLGEGVFTWGDDMPSPLLFTPSSLVGAAPGGGGNTAFCWQTSSVYMNFVAMPGTGNCIGVFFKANFMGNGSSLGCYHFYARYRGLTAGYTASLFTDGAAEPMTIDFQGPDGYPYLNVFTAYWQQKFTDKFSVAIGVDAPTASMTTGQTTGMVSQRIPAIPFYLQYAWNAGNSHVRISGLVRPMQYRDITEASNITEIGRGVQLSGVANVVGGLSVCFNGTYGQGIGTYLQDDYGLGLDAVTTTDPGKMATVNNMGLTGGVCYSFSQKVSANITYSHLTNWLPKNGMSAGNQYRLGDYAAANMICNINKFVSAGIEYDYGHRKNFNGDSLHASRLQCQLAVTF